MSKTSLKGKNEKVEVNLIRRQCRLESLIGCPSNYIFSSVVEMLYVGSIELRTDQWVVLIMSLISS